GGHRTGRHAERGRRQPLRPKPARQPRLISRGSSAAGAYFALRGAFFAVLRALAAVFGFFGLAVALAALRPRPPLLGPLASSSASACGSPRARPPRPPARFSASTATARFRPTSNTSSALGRLAKVPSCET